MKGVITMFETIISISFLVLASISFAIIKICEHNTYL